MQKLLKAITVSSFAMILCIPLISHASTTSGTIDSTNRYAWSENAGWIDFGTTAGAVTVTDTALSGYVYGENIGWISLNCSNTGSCASNSYAVTNNSEGKLSGYAWSANAGWINFSSTTINSSGVFTGYAYSENLGWINFTTDHPVTTDWRPASSRTTSTPTPTPTPVVSNSSSGGSVSNAVLATLLAPSASTTAYLNSRASVTPITTSVPNCPTGFTCKPAPGYVAPTNLAVPTTSTLPSVDLTLGSRGNDVIALQNFLIAGKYLDEQYNTGYFGILTQSALAKYQSDHNITPASGYYGPKTRASINVQSPMTNPPAQTSNQVTTTTPVSTPAYTRNLTLGSQGSDVLALQQYLNAHSATVASSGPGSPGNETDYFGPATQSALAAFQKANGISPASGYFGPITREYMASHQ